MLFQKNPQKECKHCSALFLTVGFTYPQQRFLPRKGLWGSVNLLSYSADMFDISHGSTSTFVALPRLVTTSLDSMSAGLLWLGTLSIQTGKLNSDSISNMEFKSLSLFLWCFKSLSNEGTWDIGSTTLL